MLFHKRFISIHIIGNIEYSLHPQSSDTLVEATISDFHSIHIKITSKICKIIIIIVTLYYYYHYHYYHIS